MLPFRNYGGFDFSSGGLAVGCSTRVLRLRMDGSTKWTPADSIASGSQSWSRTVAIVHRMVKTLCGDNIANLYTDSKKKHFNTSPKHTDLYIHIGVFNTSQRAHRTYSIQLLFLLKKKLRTYMYVSLSWLADIMGIDKSSHLYPLCRQLQRNREHYTSFQTTELHYSKNVWTQIFTTKIDNNSWNGKQV